MPFRTNDGNRDRARDLRRNMTEAEKKLWSRLRGRQIGQRKFRRLVIEVDGGQHAEMTVQDQQRTEKLEAAGYRVLRFGNPDVMRNVDGVVEVVMCAVGGA